MSWRVVLFDLDGTLLGHERVIHADNLRAIERLHAGGVKVGLATGRSPLSARPYAERVRPTAPLVHFNGAMVRRFDDGAVLFQRALAAEVALAALAAARALGVHANVYVGDELWIDEPSEISRENERKDGLPHTVKGNVAALLSAARIEPIKLMLIAPAAHIPDVMPTIAAAVGDGATLVRSEPEYLEVLPPGCSKLEGAQHVAAALSVTIDEVMAFGDNLNDLALLEGCGLGVAMGNAHHTVLARADERIGDHGGDAIARFLDGFDVVDGALVRRR